MSSKNSKYWRLRRWLTSIAYGLIIPVLSLFGYFPTGSTSDSTDDKNA